MGATSLDLVPSTVDVVLLRTLVSHPMHGYGISRVVRERTGGELVIEGAALYQALHRLERKRWLRSSWGVSEHRRKAKFYSLTPEGREHLRAQSATLRRYVEVLTAVLSPA
jgi:transcriptional regulator